MSSPSIIVIDTTPEHIREMTYAMQPQSAENALQLGITAKKALWQSYRNSLICRTAFINGKLAAIWGIGGTCMSEVGYPWLAMTPEIEPFPFKVAFTYKAELNKMQKLFPRLVDYVVEGNDKAFRMLKLMGFKVCEEPIQRYGIKFFKCERMVS